MLYSTKRIKKRDCTGKPGAFQPGFFGAEYFVFQHNKWGKEEKSSNPFKKGEDFDLRIRVHDDKFEIFGNQKEIHVYKTRVNIAAVEYFAVRKDVQLKGVHWGGRYYNLPFETQFPGGYLRAEERVYVYGIPKGDRFEINFLAQNGDILFHFNPRFKEKKNCTSSGRESVNRESVKDPH
ncbi:unnamed protein product [Gongylonema pulchrum]|uniref:Galectin n=2 Tax=Gongylonema pulchrum TaxID=637853 RepID=A0A3P6QD89_9BILA|nr:unnamed protein product [Gongylonema pulchrum]